MLFCNVEQRYVKSFHSNFLQGLGLGPDFGLSPTRVLRFAESRVFVSRSQYLQAPKNTVLCCASRTAACASSLFSTTPLSIRFSPAPFLQGRCRCGAAADPNSNLGRSQRQSLYQT